MVYKIRRSKYQLATMSSNSDRWIVITAAIGASYIEVAHFGKSTKLSNF